MQNPQISPSASPFLRQRNTANRDCNDVESGKFQRAERNQIKYIYCFILHAGALLETAPVTAATNEISIVAGNASSSIQNLTSVVHTENAVWQTKQTNRSCEYKTSNNRNNSNKHIEHIAPMQTLPSSSLQQPHCSLASMCSSSSSIGCGNSGSMAAPASLLKAAAGRQAPPFGKVIDSSSVATHLSISAVSNIDSPFRNLYCQCKHHIWTRQWNNLNGYYLAVIDLNILTENYKPHTYS